MVTKAAFLYHKNTGQWFPSCFVLFSYFIFVCGDQTQMHHVQSCRANFHSRMQVKYTDVYFASMLFTSCDLTSIWYQTSTDQSQWDHDQSDWNWFGAVTMLWGIAHCKSALEWDHQAFRLVNKNHVVWNGYQAFSH